jgi:hypothetical protein
MEVLYRQGTHHSKPTVAAATPGWLPKEGKVPVVDADIRHQALLLGPSFDGAVAMGCRPLIARHDNSEVAEGLPSSIPLRQDTDCEALARSVCLGRATGIAGGQPLALAGGGNT